MTAIGPLTIPWQAYPKAAYPNTRFEDCNYNHLFLGRRPANRLDALRKPLISKGSKSRKVTVAVVQSSLAVFANSSFATITPKMSYRADQVSARPIGSLAAPYRVDGICPSADPQRLTVPHAERKVVR